MTPDPRDTILQSHTPVVMVPRFGELRPIEKPGHRFLAAQDGLWLEVLRPWLHAAVLAAPSEVALPYGRVEQRITYGFSQRDLEEVEGRFLHDAASAFPDECAAWAVYDDRTGTLEYWPLIATEASPGSVTLARPRLQDHQHLAIDIHSHGAIGACFSGTDDEDDAGEVKYAVVIGNIDQELTFARRLCLLGMFIEESA